MNILIDIPDLNKENGGIYQYAVALIKILAKGNLPHHFYILCSKPDQDIKEVVEENFNFHFTKTQPPIYSRYGKFRIRIFNFLFRILRLKKRLKKNDLYDCIIFENGIDIIHTPIQSLVKKQNVKSITTLHDVQELHFPEFFTSAQRASRAVNFKKVIDGSDAVIVSYDHVKNDIVKYFEKPINQVHTVLLDMQDLWFKKITIRNNKVLDRFNLPSNFLLYPASSWEHKNHLCLIKAIKLLNNANIHLICTGHLTEYYKSRIKPFIEEQGLTDKIKFVGIVLDEELFELYHNCRAVVVPTLYEAGSFPLVESILMGIPVVCSNVTSLPETIGDGRFVFNPIDIEDIANKIDKIWSDDIYRNENIALLKIQAEKLYFNNAASNINVIYDMIFEKH
jgi:glycosyltransferase involved in cell wall biosynthesis